ncbi:hypothetical protein UT300019_24000 [Clostridium sp. CTA-19]
MISKVGIKVDESKIKSFAVWARRNLIVAVREKANRIDTDYIYLVWKDYKTRKRYIVRELSKNGKYEFKYRIENGF